MWEIFSLKITVETIEKLIVSEFLWSLTKQEAFSVIKINHSATT